MGKKRKRKSKEDEYLTLGWQASATKRKAESGKRKPRIDGTERTARYGAGRPCESHGPGFLEIVSGPGPLNALYVSCNLIPRRSVRCPDRRVIYANSWASGSPTERHGAARPPGFLLTPDATVVSPLPLSRSIRHPTLVELERRRSTVDGHQEDGVRAHSIVSPILR